MVLIKLTLPIHKKLLMNHLLSLNNEDRRLRFGASLRDDSIISYVEKTYNQFSQDWFAIIEPSKYFLDDDKIIASAHISLYGHHTHVTGELGLTVDANHRGLGYGSMLFDKAISYSKAHNVTSVYMQCLSENKAIQHIARKNKMTIGTIERNEKEATIKINRTPFDSYNDAISDGLALYDYAMHKLDFTNIFKI